MNKPFTRIAGCIFAIVDAGHAMRMAFGWDVTIGGWTVPLWVSILGTIVPALLAVMLWREART